MIAINLTDYNGLAAIHMAKIVQQVLSRPNGIALYLGNHGDFFKMAVPPHETSRLIICKPEDFNDEYLQYAFNAVCMDDVADYIWSAGLLKSGLAPCISDEGLFLHAL